MANKAPAKTVSKSSPAPASKPQTTNVPANRPSTAVAKIDEDVAAMLGGGVGNENVTADTRATPFLLILQDLSPQVKTKMAGYVQGAKPGMFFRTDTQALFDKVKVVPVYFSRVLIEWVPRDAGGGFVSVSPFSVQLLATTKREGIHNVLPNGNHLVDTHQHFCLMLNEEGPPEPVLIAMKSTNLKVSRRWNSTISAPKMLSNGQVIPDPARYLCSYELSTEEEANESGSWWQWAIGNQVCLANDSSNWPLIKAANALANQLGAGNVKVDYNEMETAGTTAGPAEGAPQDLDNEIDA